MLGAKPIDEAMNARLAGVRKPVANSADINFVNRLGVTDLMVACQGKRREVAGFLLTNGADAERRERYSERNALTYSCLSGDSRIVKLFLDHGVAVDSTDATGRSFLIGAAAIGKAELVRLLLQSGAKLHPGDHAGAMPWDWPSIEDREESVKLLNARGAFGIGFPDGFTATNAPQRKG